jgi:hypothetical protein
MSRCRGDVELLPGHPARSPYRLATPIRVIRIGYFDPRMRDLGGVDRLTLDLAELEALRLGAARVTVPLMRTYSLARETAAGVWAVVATGGSRRTLAGCGRGLVPQIGGVLADVSGANPVQHLDGAYATDSRRAS